MSRPAPPGGPGRNPLREPRYPVDMQPPERNRPAALPATEQTIVALSTAAGLGARAVVRLTGPETFAIGERLFVPRRGRLGACPGFVALDGRVRLEAAELPGRAYVFRAPRSYTTGDLLELHVPGSPAVAEAVLAEALAAGARPAEPGEFTLRALLGGRLTLAEAEAVAEVIAAEGRMQLRAASTAQAGRLARSVEGIQARLVEVLAMVEAAVDLPEEDLPLPSAEALAGQLAEAGRQLQALAAGAGITGNAAEARVALVGLPNAGKSSLLNALTGTDRAIVSATAHTTRDVLTASMPLAGFGEVVLEDLAGLARAGREAGDPLLACAHRSAWAALAAARVVVFVCDGPGGDPSAENDLLAELARRGVQPSLAAAAKADLWGADAVGALARRSAELAGSAPLLAVSSNSRSGLAALRAALAERLNTHAVAPGGAVAVAQRQAGCCTQAAEAVARAADLLAAVSEPAEAAELVAVELRAALAEMVRLTGHAPEGAYHGLTEDLLGEVFARFCVGK